MNKLILSSLCSAVIFPILSVVAFGVELPEQALSHANPRVKEVMAIQEEVTPELLSMQDVLGTAVGQDDDGEVNIVVYINLKGKNPAATVRNIPKSLRGENVIVQLTEPFRALAKPQPPVPQVSHTAIQAPPIQLGTSGGWGKDLANGYCCGGTLGSLVAIGPDRFVLSNYHVFESDIVGGGNSTVATTFDSIIQPGLIDVGCSIANAQEVGELVVNKSLPYSNVDASIAKVVGGKVRDDGSILEIGAISSTTAAAHLKQAVKKSGRTTGLTRSTVSGLNGTISVVYDDECAGKTAFTKMFTGQILINNRASKFLAGGDSGSLMVEDTAPNPKAVGLLFAGSNTLAVANPINDVLEYFDATMVGQ